MPGPKLKFPDPKNVKPKNPAVFCTGERVIGLYNQNHEKPARRISAKVKEWFAEEALGSGWGGVHFIPEIQTEHGAGCVLWLRRGNATVEVEANIKVTKRTLVLGNDGE